MISSTVCLLEVNNVRLTLADLVEDEEDAGEAAEFERTARRGSPSSAFDEFFVAEDLGLPRGVLGVGGVEPAR